MDAANRAAILKMLEGANDLTIATNRPDGWPQATTVSFVHDGLTIYVGIGPQGQKAKNIARDKRVSIVVDAPYRSWHEIKGLSMAAEAEPVSDRSEVMRIASLMVSRFGPEFSDLPSIEQSNFEFIRIRPKIVSVLDYTKGFGHTDLIEVAPSDLA